MSRQSNRLPYVLLALASLVYLGLSLLSPVTKAQQTYAISSTVIHLLVLTIALPVVAVWFTALWGSLRFRHYAVTIQESPDGTALKTLANGLLTLVTGLIINSLMQGFDSWMIQWGAIKPWQIATNYVSVALALAAMLLILNGAWGLARLVALKGVRAGQLLAVGLVAICGVGYVLLLLHDPYRSSTPDPSRYTSYYLPGWLVVVTLILPYLATWYAGLVAVACLRAYQRYSPGIIYRKALRRLSQGLLVVVVASIVLQLFTAFGPILSRWHLNDILELLYLLIVIYAAGHVLVAIGARNLSRIESGDES